jgi:hypothetical protein
VFWTVKKLFQQLYGNVNTLTAGDLKSDRNHIPGLKARHKKWCVELGLFGAGSIKAYPINVKP